MMDSIMKQAQEAKEHLERVLGSVADVRCLAEDMQRTKNVFLEVLGERLYKKVTFITKREDLL